MKRFGRDWCQLKRWVACAVVLAITQSALADDEWVGKKFMPMRDCVPMTNQEKVPIELLPLPLHVQQVSEGWLWVGRAWVEKQHVVPLAEAEDYYTKLVDDEATRVWALTNRAVVFQELDRIDDALKDYSEALKTDPQHAVAYNNRGVLRRNRKQWDQAIQDFDEAIRINPEYVTAYYNRGNAYHDQQKLERAAADFSRAVELDEKCVPAYYNRALVYHDQRNYRQAVDDYNTTIRLAPRFTLAYNNRGNLWLDKGDWKKAIADYSEAIKLAPQDADPLSNRAWVRATASDKRFRDGKAAVADALKACELTNWKNAHQVDTLAAAYAESGEFDKAVSAQRKALGLLPRDDTFREGFEARLKLYRANKPYRSSVSQTAAIPADAATQ